MTTLWDEKIQKTKSTQVGSVMTTLTKVEMPPIDNTMSTHR
jgi:hypothetical protein